jgi:hypothetical protein
MKRFHLFAGEHYYPSCGVGDYMGVYATLDAAQRAYDKRNDWAVVAWVNDDGELVEVASTVDNNNNWIAA